MMYTIRITYETGDSFGSSTEEDEIPMLWCNLDTAQLALESIKEHKEAFEHIRKTRYKAEEDEVRIRYEASSFWWDYDSPEYSLMLFDDTGRLQKVHAFWIGYFENIKVAEIIQYQEEGERAMKIVF